MELVTDLIKILLPAAAVLYAMYLTVRSFLTKDFERRLIDIRIKNNEIVLPIRLQAYERMALFLERISPHNLVMRVNESSYNAYELQQRLVMEIREEYNHNLSQQVYMSDQAWELIKNAKEEVISIINTAASNVPSEAKSIELAKMIFEKLIQRPEEPTTRALKFLKNEIRQSF
ncbi:MAG: hypothetical protein NZ529_04655 [Cytophagaceae bacterium]|nr:hypothetical protein [Cytophagaceae bacterium]MDW8456066.1 hypothetical protein [Cytophagaceae bacterium]